MSEKIFREIKMFYIKYGKRLFDLFLVFLTIPIWLPVFFLVYIVVFIHGRPVFYHGERIGKDLKTFKIVKFRTMAIDSGNERSGDTVFEGDKRVGKMGGFLRKYKLDEIPQLFLVLSGKMSLVGPRPELPIYVDREYYYKHGISDLRPGITDFSSIKFRDLSSIIPKGDTNTFVKERIIPQKNKLRKFYAERVSFCTDLIIILRTLKSILR